MSIQPEGEQIRRATKWIAEERRCHAGERGLQELVQAASLKFDLSPIEAEFLIRCLSEKGV